MPTVLLLDVSLSMCRQASVRPIQDTNESEINREAPAIRQLARVGVGILCDYFSQNSQLEHVALVVFSSLYEIRHQFTRDHDSVKSAACLLETYDKSNVVNAIRGILSMKLEEWAQDGPINIILITDGQVYNTDLYTTVCNDTQDIDYEFRDVPLRELEGQFNFDCKLQVVCLTSPRDPALKLSLPFYKKLVSIVDRSISGECPVLTGSVIRNFERSAIWLPESNTLDINKAEVENLFMNIAELNYKPFHLSLSCGHLSSMVMLSPKPTDCLVEPLKNEFDDLKNEESQQRSQESTKEIFVSALNKTKLFELTDDINICGFMPLSEIASPAIISRHIVFPISNSKFNETSKAEQILSQDPNAYSKSLQQTCPIEQETGSTNKESTEKSHGTHHSSAQPPTNDHHLEKDITKRPSFCVLLHNCLKQENMVAICIVGKNDDTNEEWFGTLHSHTDSRKRSCLMLSLLLPGPNPILWLPSFKSLGSALLNSDLPPAILERLASNGGGSGGKSSSRSYSTNNVIWLDPESVQADVQKIIRHAKRAPDKAPHFYKELNRIRRAAISYGFYDVLYGLASILEREKSIMLSDRSKPANTDIIKHIDHVIASLRVKLTEDSFETNITAPVS